MSGEHIIVQEDQGAAFFVWASDQAEASADSKAGELGGVTEEGWQALYESYLDTYLAKGRSDYKMLD